MNNKQSCMEQEIYSQPKIIANLIEKYIKSDSLADFKIPDSFEKIVLIASGSSYHSACIASVFFTKTLGYSASVYYSSEFILFDDYIVDSDTLYIFISQSGETVDTNNAFKIVSEKTNKTLCITNTENSFLYNNCTYKVLTFAGIEKAIASTKAMSAQVFCLLLLCVKIAVQKNIPHQNMLDELLLVPEYLNKTFDNITNINKIAELIAKYDNSTILASGLFYHVAQEAALKIKETSYINTTAYHTGEFLHGHIAILNKKSSLFIIADKQNYNLSKFVLNKINAKYNAEIIIISLNQQFETDKYTTVSVFGNSNIAYVFSCIALFQLISCKSALLRNMNVDSPIGLEKIVK